MSVADLLVLSWNCSFRHHLSVSCPYQSSLLIVAGQPVRRGNVYSTDVSKAESARLLAHTLAFAISISMFLCVLLINAYWRCCILTNNKTELDTDFEHFLVVSTVM